MTDYDIYAKDGRRKKVRTTIPDVSAPPLPDLVQRGLLRRRNRRSAPVGTSPTWRPGRVGSTWPTSSTSASRRIIGSRYGDHMRSELVDGRHRHGSRHTGRRRRRHDVPPRPRVPVHVAETSEAL